MKKLLFPNADNPYFRTPNITLLETILISENKESSKLGFNFAVILLGYPSTGWQKELDIFQFLDKKLIYSLQHENTVLIADYTFEGFSRHQCPIIEILEKNAFRYNINSKKIFYCSGNLKDYSPFINALSIYTLDHATNFRANRGTIYTSSVDSAIQACRKSSVKKICLSLSRRNRYNRVLAHCILYNSEISKHCIISQAKLDDFCIDETTLQKAQLSPKSIKRFQKKLPLIADTDRFDINEPFNPLLELHSQTLFSIVNETSHDNYNNSSLFISEKILKPIINFQPMIIWGQQHVNKAITELGFQTYDSYFNLDFDSEPDNVLRYKQLLQSITPLTKELASMDVEEKISWRFRHRELLEYNYKVFCANYHSGKQKKIFLQRIKELFRMN